MFKKGTTLKLTNGLGVKVLEQLSEGGFAFVRAFAATPAPRLPLPKYLCSWILFRCAPMRCDAQCGPATPSPSRNSL